MTTVIEFSIKTAASESDDLTMTTAAEFVGRLIPGAEVLIHSISVDTVDVSRFGDPVGRQIPGRRCIEGAAVIRSLGSVE